MADFDISFDPFAGIVGAANSIYNLFTNKRDFDYQKALQAHMEEREDTAVQRRKADLEAAGFNPALAMGQAAQAGPVVARSSTNDVNMGSMLDTMMAAKQIKQQEIQTQNAKVENDILKIEKNTKAAEEAVQRLNTFSQLGLNVGITPIFGENGDFHFDFSIPTGTKKLKDTPFGQNFIQVLNKQLHDTAYAKTAAEYLDKELKFQTADHVADYIKSGTGLLKLLH